MPCQDVILSIVTLADQGRSVEAGEAVRAIAGLIERLDRTRESYAQDRQTLLRIGATVWRQQLRASGLAAQAPARRRRTRLQPGR